ncbi:MAG: hypothetical protein AAGA48_19550 [Myxococcota bacterium]
MRWLKQALSGRLVRWWKPALAVAQEADSALPSVLEEAFAQTPLLPDNARVTLYNALPEAQRTVALAPLAVLVAEALLQSGALDEAARAARLTNLGLRLSALGQREAALQATEEAVGLYRPLAEAQPDAFLPDLAGSLWTHGDSLTAMDDRKDDAVEAYGEALTHLVPLARQHPNDFRGQVRGTWADLQAARLPGTSLSPSVACACHELVALGLLDSSDATEAR